MIVLLTGASGFLGKVYQKELNGYELITLSRNNSMLKVDLSNEIPVLPEVDVVIHAAGLAHTVPKKDAEGRAFFEVNEKGTENLLKGLSNSVVLPRSFVFISSVAVYGKDKGILIGEDEPLLATDPYGLSKIAAEKLVTDWCAENNVVCTILRLPLIAGEQPLGNLGAMIKGLKKGYYFNIGAGEAKKSIVLASDVVKATVLAIPLGGTYNLTDGYHPSFKELSSCIAHQLQKPSPKHLSLKLVNLIAKFGDLVGAKAPINTNKLTKMTADLTFDDTTARTNLGWKSNAVLDQFKILY